VAFSPVWPLLLRKGVELIADNYLLRVPFDKRLDLLEA
jgi:hypothetical protein